jgi:rRNA maturation endonuclease Nob1
VCKPGGYFDKHRVKKAQPEFVDQTVHNTSKNPNPVNDKSIGRAAVKTNVKLEQSIKGERICTNCDKSCLVKDAFCSACGSKLIAEKLSFCQNCKKEFLHEDPFCSSCGTKRKIN